MAMPPASLPFLLAATDAKHSALFTWLFPDNAGPAERWFTIGLVGIVFALLTFTTLTPDIIMLGAVVVLMLLGILSPDLALAGMSDPGVLSIGALFVVAAGMQETGGINWVATHLFGRPKSVLSGIARLVFPTMGLSAFIANTPLVVMLLPAVDELSRRQRISASKLMIPLSYAAILGGTCTLIGTSTNLTVRGLLQKMNGHELQMFDIAWVGVPVAIVGGIYTVLAARWLLPDRKSPLSAESDPREYTVEMEVEAASPLVGKSIEAAGLRHLPGLFLAEIDRDGNAIPAVSPREVLQAGDRLLFVGVVESVVELQKIRGLVPATEDVFHLKAPRPQRCLIEAVVSNTSPMLGKTIRDARFRSHYNAVVVAVARNGQRLREKIGDIILHAGDVVLVEAHPSFADQHRNSRDFYLVSTIEGSSPPRHNLALVAVGLVVALVVTTAMGWISVLLAGMIVAGLMLALRCVSISTARKAINWETLLTIAASFALGTALEKTGAAAMITDAAVRLSGGNPWTSLAAIYICTLIATELISNNTAAALMLPLALAAAKQLDVSFMPFVIAVMMGASAGFATPFGYQTNLMVYGPGGYRFMDYVKIGLPLDIIVGAITIVLAPWAFPFRP
jgi:di/tricarboxylate transporter